MFTPEYMEFWWKVLAGGVGIIFWFARLEYVSKQNEREARRIESKFDDKLININKESRDHKVELVRREEMLWQKFDMLQTSLVKLQDSMSRVETQITFVLNPKQHKGD